MNNSTNFNMSDPWWLQYIEPTPDVPHPIVIILITIGTIGNMLVCLSVYFDKKLRNVTTYFLLSLAVTDLLINVAVLPARVLAHIFVAEPPNFPLCYLYFVGDDYLTAASALHICVISAQRYFAIKNPLGTLNVSMRQVYVRVGLVWLISLLSVIPYITIIAISNLPIYPAHCPHLLAFMKAFEVVLYTEALIIFIMMAVVFFFFIRTSLILFKLIEKQTTNGQQTDITMVRTIGGKGSETNPKLQKCKDLNSEMKALRVVWLVSFAFMISMGPYAVVNIVHLLGPKIKIPTPIVKAAAYLTYSNSVVNPIIYTIFSKRFRNSFKNILLCRFQRT